MKTKGELNALKVEVETVNKKLAELTEEELTQVSGGGSLAPPELEDLNLDSPIKGFDYTDILITRY